MDQLLQFDAEFQARFPHSVRAVRDLREIFANMRIDSAGTAAQLFADTYHLYVWQRLKAWHSTAVDDRVVRIQRVLLQILNQAGLRLSDAVVVLSVLLEQTAMFAVRSERGRAAGGQAAGGWNAGQGANGSRAWSPDKDYYEVLDLHPDASQEMIDRARRHLAMKYHPDRNPERKEWATAKMAAINEAHEVLSDARKRAEYDRQAGVKR